MNDMTETIVTIANVSLIAFIITAVTILTKIGRVVVSAYTQWANNDSASITFFNNDGRFMNVSVNYPKGNEIWAATYNQEGTAISLRKVIVHDKEGTVEMDDSAKKARLFSWNGNPSPDVSTAIWDGNDSRTLPNGTSCLTEIRF